jgi:hypothetical protein
MKRVIIILAVFLVIPAVAFCSTTKFMERDTELHPQGWIAGALTFREGTTVTLNDNNEVISGDLRWNERLLTVGYSSALFEGLAGEGARALVAFKPGRVTFNERGLTLSGTLQHDATVILYGDANPVVYLKYCTYIEFNNDGSLLRGTPKADTYFHPKGWRTSLPNDTNAGFVKFKGLTEVLFGSNGEVITGTLANDVTINGTTYPAGTTLRFSETANPQRI